jgi:hypothetical protein
MKPLAAALSRPAFQSRLASRMTLVSGSSRRFRQSLVWLFS